MKKKATKADKYFEGYGTKKAKTPPPKGWKRTTQYTPEDADSLRGLNEAYQDQAKVNAGMINPDAWRSVRHKQRDAEQAQIRRAQTARDEAVTQREMDNYEWKGLKIKNPRAPKFDAKGNPVAKKGAAATKYLKTKK